MHPLAIGLLTLITLKLSLKVNLVINWYLINKVAPINCVGVYIRTFGIKIHKCSNVEILHSFIPYLVEGSEGEDNCSTNDNSLCSSKYWNLLLL